MEGTEEVMAGRVYSFCCYLEWGLEREAFFDLFYCFVLLSMLVMCAIYTHSFEKTNAHGRLILSIHQCNNGYPTGGVQQIGTSEEGHAWVTNSNQCVVDQSRKCKMVKKTQYVGAKLWHLSQSVFFSPYLSWLMTAPL